MLGHNKLKGADFRNFQPLFSIIPKLTFLLLWTKYKIFLETSQHSYSSVQVFLLSVILDYIAADI